MENFSDTWPFLKKKSENYLLNGLENGKFYFQSLRKSVLSSLHLSEKVAFAH